MIKNYTDGLIYWKGKNVKNDELDLEVPMDDVGGIIGNNGCGVTIMTRSNKMRIYDVRGTHKRPVKENCIKGLAPRSSMVKMVQD
jgi:hypothetical protein